MRIAGLVSKDISSKTETRNFGWDFDGDSYWRSNKILIQPQLLINNGVRLTSND